ncbi:MAG: hypothetical protein DI534_06950 [Leifsonia xyli]|nr:MAG: hypothetical protein DI534_06950 [Leifsonia xyli]
MSEQDETLEQVTAPGGDAPAPGEAVDPALPRPRIRVGAALWGLVLIVVAGAVLWTASSPARRASALDAILGLDPLGWTVVLVVTLGATITLIALAAVLRRLQRR